MKVLLRKSVRGHNNLFEWSKDGKTWYLVNGHHIKAEPDLSADDPFEVFRYYREAINKLCQDARITQVFQAEYNNETKVLTLRKLK